MRRGVHALEGFVERLRKSRGAPLLCGARAQTDQLLQQADFIERIGAENMLPHVEVR